MFANALQDMSTSVGTFPSSSAFSSWPNDSGADSAWEAVTVSEVCRLPPPRTNAIAVQMQNMTVRIIFSFYSCPYEQSTAI